MESFSLLDGEGYAICMQLFFLTYRKGVGNTLLIKDIYDVLNKQFAEINHNAV